MKEQLKAEAFVREARPALMELSFGCEVEATNNFNAGENDYRDIKIGDRYICGGDTWVNLWEARQKERYKIIGHPINLQDWLGVLPDHGRFSDFYWEEGDDVVIQFNRTTGQPATEADYKAFNEITNI